MLRNGLTTSNRSDPVRLTMRLDESPVCRDRFFETICFLETLSDDERPDRIGWTQASASFGDSNSTITSLRREQSRSIAQQEVPVARRSCHTRF